MCMAAMPPASLPVIPFTMLGLTLVAIGTGGIKPCVSAFGGDQFYLPQQEDSLRQFFSIFYFTINFGALAGMILTPILRNIISCFGYDTCYAAGFGFPAVLMFATLVLFVSGKPLYRLKAPKENVTAMFVGCTIYALSKKIRSKDEPPEEHWLDYAKHRYTDKWISDMKRVLGILLVYAPLPVFWSLFDQQGSRWIFQASRMNGNVMGIQILPEHVQAINPVIVLALIPFFKNVLYPFLEKFGVPMGLLHRMVGGGLVAGLAFFVSGAVETWLEATYPVLPGKGETHINFVNMLPCNVHILNPFNHLQTINTTENFVFRSVASHEDAYYSVLMFANMRCGRKLLVRANLEFEIPASEYQINTVLIYLKGPILSAFLTEPDDTTKSLHGNSKIRIVFVRDDVFRKAVVSLNGSTGTSRTYFMPRSAVGLPDYMELSPGRYTVSFSNEFKMVRDRELLLEFGGVYTLVLQEIDGIITFCRLYAMAPPNSMHMVWLVPQYVLISVAEVMFAISGLEFSFTQAPKSMKTVTMALWYLSAAIGNLLMIVIMQARLFSSQAHEFFLFAVLILVDMVLFGMVTSRYKPGIMECDSMSSRFRGSKH